MAKKQLGILLSGRGSNFEAIAENVEQGGINAEIAIVISDVADARGLDIARQRKLEARFLDPRGKSREDFDREVVALLVEHKVDLVCLAGFMRILSPFFIQQFPARILNIHPALLPSFKGLHAQRQALRYGVKVSGCSVHFVDDGVDSGPIIIQAVVPVLDDDTEETLSQRILKEEHRIYSQAIRWIIEDRVQIAGRRVRILETPV
ncbi:MAG: phosphoribosylglycinamide formyltransferase [Acidobacteriia bacterium]|nr:phosphoribosylglycinamide formyltransferase [Terriglobia bacterium]